MVVLFFTFIYSAVSQPRLKYVTTPFKLGHLYKYFILHDYKSGMFCKTGWLFVAQSSWARMAPRVNQLRAEECADVSNTREVAHEREIHTAMQMGQSCEDLTLVAGLANSPTRIPRY